MEFIPLIRPDIRQEDLNAVNEVLLSGMLVQGKNVQTFETRIADYIGVKNAIAVTNGTATLHLSLVALGIGPGDEVLVPAFSYVATANVVELVGATPVFVDVVLPDCNIDVEKIEASITKKTKAILPVHEFGLACNIREVINIAKKYSLYVIEDAACALGSKHDGQPVGSFGIAGSFSFHPRKSITAGEGGLITTNDDDLAAQLRLLRNHGQTSIQNKMDFALAGYNCRLTDFQAALLNSQFNRFDEIISAKEIIAQKYFQALSDNKNITLPTYPGNKLHTWQTFHIILAGHLNRDNIISKLAESKIGVNYGAQCIPFMQFYKEKYKLDCSELFPCALQAFQFGLALPIYPGLLEKEVDYVIKKINDTTH